MPKPTTPTLDQQAGQGGTSQQSAVTNVATEVPTSPIPKKESDQPTPASATTPSEPTSESPEFEQAQFKKGEEVELDFGSASEKPLAATISGVYSDDEGISYQADVTTKDGVPMLGNKATTVRLTVPASIVQKPKASESDQKA